jgi:hypothetical protein
MRVGAWRVLADEKERGNRGGECVVRDALHGRLAAIQIDQAVVSEATKRGLRATAIPDITARARLSLKPRKRVPQALEADRQTVRPSLLAPPPSPFALRPPAAWPLASNLHSSRA